jgi:hypothetical protein
MSVVDENDDSYQMINSSSSPLSKTQQQQQRKKLSFGSLNSLSFSSQPSLPPEPSPFRASAPFVAASTVGLAKLRLLKKMKQAKATQVELSSSAERERENEEFVEHTSPPRSRTSSENLSQDPLLRTSFTSQPQAVGKTQAQGSRDEKRTRGNR